MRRILSVAGILMGLASPSLAQEQAQEQEKSISLDKALEIVKKYYSNIFAVDIFWLEEFPEQWHLFVDEQRSANWSHDCTTYIFPNTGDLAIDTVPEVNIPEWGLPPVDIWDDNPISVYAHTSVSVCGDVERKTKKKWKTLHSLGISGPIDETDFKTLRQYIYEGQLGYVRLENAQLANNKIPNFAFRDTELTDYAPLNLQRIALPNSIETIGEYAFNACNLEFITFPASLKRIEGYSCNDLEKIQWIYSQAQTPPKCDGNAFGGLTPKSTPIYVPIGTAELYRKAAGWKYFTTFIETDVDPQLSISDIPADRQLESKAFYSNGAIHIESTVSSAYSIYTIEGRKIAQGETTNETTTVPTSKAIYIVKVGNTVHKIK